MCGRPVAGASGRKSQYACPRHPFGSKVRARWRAAVLPATEHPGPCGRETGATKFTIVCCSTRLLAALHGLQGTGRTRARRCPRRWIDRVPRDLPQHRPDGRAGRSPTSACLPPNQKIPLTTILCSPLGYTLGSTLDAVHRARSLYTSPISRAVNLSATSTQDGCAEPSFCPALEL